SQQRRHAEELEVVRRYESPLRGASTRPRIVEDIDMGTSCNVLEYLILLANRNVFRNGEPTVVIAAASRLIMDGNDHQPVGVFVGKKIEKEVEENAEDDCGRSDAQGESENGQESETSILSQISDSE